MKTTIFTFLLSLMSFQSISQLNFYGGIQTQGANSTDFQDFHISDWATYGLLSEDPSSLEGRVRVPLGVYKPGFLNLGIFFGADYFLGEKLSVLGEMQYNVSGISNLGLNVGATYNWFNSEKIRQGLSFRFGYNTGSADFGTITLIDGYTPPVILAEGTFDEGDYLSMSFSGAIVGFGLSTDFKLSDNFGVRIESGYQLGFLSSDGLIAGGVAIPMSSVGVVSDDLSGTQAGLYPTLTTSGVNIKLGVCYTLNFGK